MEYGNNLRIVGGAVLVFGGMGSCALLGALIAWIRTEGRWSESAALALLLILLIPPVVLALVLALTACVRIRVTDKSVEYVILKKIVVRRLPLKEFMHSGEGLTGPHLVFAGGRRISIPPMHPDEKRRLEHDLHGLKRAAWKETGCAHPPHPVAVDPCWLLWNDGAVGKLAQSIFAERAFDRLPILGDALEEAGCTNEEILAHCRRPGEHLHVCWVVSLILMRLRLPALN